MALREIIFRGKQIYNNGEWVEGFYHFSNWFQPPDYQTVIDTHHYIRPVNWQDAYQVDPATVGQYTGLQDKNGKKIFEGDMLKVTWNAIDREPYSEIHLVKFSKGCFCVSFGERSRGLLSGYIGMKGEGCCVTVEVIGNIHDNPELLEGHQ